MYIALLLGLVAAGIAMASFGARRRRRRLVLGGIGLTAATLAFFGLLGFWGEMLWFEEIGLLRRFWVRVIAQLVTTAGGALVATALAWLLLVPSRFGPRHVRRAGLVFAAVVGALWGAVSWSIALRWAFAVRTGTTDPVLGMDTGFYLFRLPFYDALFWLAFFASSIALIVAVLSLPRSGASAAATEADLDVPPPMLVGAGAETNGGGAAEAAGARAPSYRALFVPLGALALVLCFGRLLAPYHLMYSQLGAVHGAGWTDVHVRLPAYYVIAALLALTAIVLLVPRATRAVARPLSTLFGESPGALAAATAGAPTAVVAAAWLLGLGALPPLLQWLVVEPNEVAFERRYLEHNIAFTRDGFDLADVAIEEFSVGAELTPELLQQNEPLLSEVRLWDPHAFDDVAQQFQELRLYYEITPVDFDRYRLGDDYRQVMVAPREMEIRNLPAESQTFVNRHFKYTHGYGLVMAPVSDFTPAGMPNLLVRDLPPVSEHSRLYIDRPEIYYGELTNDFVVANSRAAEFDYPQGGANVYTHYQGEGGVPLRNFWRKLVYGWKLGGTRLLFSDYPTAESRVLFHRNIADRVETVAPFLTLDPDPYAVIVDGRIKWIVDTYTTSERYPYSEPYREALVPRTPSIDAAGARRAADVRPAHARMAAPLERANYVRNSVKVVVDAYDGKIDLYVFDPTDPIAQVWSRIYPELFKPKEAMPANLRAHVRYPEAMLETQGLVFAKYHMTDPVVFYNLEDLWVRATEKYYDEVRPVQPYYVMWQRPGSSDLEFILMQPYTPKNRQVLIGWLAGMCDGERYGQMIAYRFPKDQWVLGPQQVDTKVDQSPELSAQLTLWDQHGKRVIRGNVLAIPIDETILYVEPIYIQAQTAAYPELRMVVVMHGDDMSYAPTFAAALDGLATGRGAVTPAETEVMTLPEAAREANRAFEEYLRLTSEGRFGEAGKQLESLRASLRRLQESGPLPAR